MVKDMPLLSRSANVGSSLLGSGQGVAESPIGVLDAACFSYKCDELTTTTAVIEGSSANSCSHIDTIISTTTSTGSPEAKRQKLETSSARASGCNS